LVILRLFNIFVFYEKKMFDDSLAKCESGLITRINHKVIKHNFIQNFNCLFRHKGSSGGILIQIKTNKKLNLNSNRIE